jgi:cytochrome c oxidase subunit 3
MGRYEINEHGEIRPDSRRLISRIAMLEVALLFGGLLFAALFMGGGLPERMPALASQLFGWSTGTILLSSGLIAWAARLPQANKLLAKLMGVNLGLTLSFLLLQIGGFYQLFQTMQGSQAALHVQLLYVVVGVHGIHVLGGLLLLLPVSVRTFAGRFDPNRDRGLRLLEPYWHLLSAIWLIFYWGL